MGKELLEEIRKQADCKEYVSWRGRKCYMTYGDLDWYFLKCRQYDLEPKREGDFSYTAKGNGFEFEYCEHDIILSIDNDFKNTEKQLTTDECMEIFKGF